jgi:hypothetical protein
LLVSIDSSGRGVLPIGAVGIMLEVSDVAAGGRLRSTPYEIIIHGPGDGGPRRLTAAR